MRQYVIYSSLAHSFLILIFLLKFAETTAVKNKTYYIDFIGATPQIDTPQNETSPKISSQPSQAEEKKQQQNKMLARQEKDYFDKDDFNTSDLRPSMASQESKLLKEAASTKQGSEIPASSSPINTDSDFPYPWYITQVREALWDSWQRIMPVNSSLKCVIKFRILPNGTVSSAEIEKTSGNRMFDQTALTAVESAGKMPHLPEGFFEDYLTVHVEFKNKGG
ncbi:MAG: hypothetical protein Fur0012_06760 [Elusimicrobiota bacterium]